MDKHDVVQTHNSILLSLKMEGNPQIGYNVDESDIILSKTSQSQKGQMLHIQSHMHKVSRFPRIKTAGVTREAKEGGEDEKFWR